MKTRNGNLQVSVAAQIKEAWRNKKKKDSTNSASEESSNGENRNLDCKLKMPSGPLQERSQEPQDF